MILVCRCGAPVRQRADEDNSLCICCPLESWLRSSCQPSIYLSARLWGASRHAYLILHDFLRMRVHTGIKLAQRQRRVSRCGHPGHRGGGRRRILLPDRC